MKSESFGKMQDYQSLMVQYWKNMPKPANRHARESFAKVGQPG